MSLKLTRRAGSSLWWITGTVGGRRVRESSGTDNAKLAEEVRSARETKLLRDEHLGAPEPKHSFAKAVRSYMDNAGPHADATAHRVNRLLQHFGPAATCDDIDQARLDVACAAILRPNPAPATRLREIITPARAVLQHAAKRGWCTARPFDTGKASPARTEWLTPAEAAELVDAAAPHLRPLLVFLLATGARLGEALSLDWREVDLPHARAILRETKNGKDRIVDLCPRAVAAIAALQARAGRVFLTMRGDAYAEKQVQGGGQIKTGWRSALRRSGIDREVSPHSLRHTWASWHYAEHRDVLLLKSAGGWSSVDLVERYAHLVPAGMVPAVEAWRAGGPAGGKVRKARA
jgi:integrase